MKERNEKESLNCPQVERDITCEMSHGPISDMYELRYLQPNRKIKLIAHQPRS